jgi:hypothetical protein
MLPSHHASGRFVRAAARMLWCTASPRVALLNFWIPVGLALTSRVVLFASACLVSLSIPALLFQSDPRLPSVRPFPFSKRARAINTCPNICFRIMSPFHHFPVPY